MSLSRAAFYKRPIRVFMILGRQKPSDVAVAAPQDFRLQLSHILSEIEAPAPLLPYSVNVETERLLLTAVSDVRSVLEAPFLYQAQYTAATSIISVPVERLLELGGTMGLPATFIFSIGRCGSTLLTALLRSVGIASISECDVFTYLAMMRGETRQLLGPWGVREVIRQTVAILSGHSGFIKLRSHCNSIAEEIVTAVPEARVVYILRDGLSWARSRHRVFGDSIPALAGMLKSGVESYDKLVQKGSDPVLIWYEDMRSDPVTVLLKLGVPAAVLDATAPGVLAEALMKDAQDGTSIGRNAYQDRILSADAVRQLVSEWQRIAPWPLLERHGLQRLSSSLSFCNS